MEEIQKAIDAYLAQSMEERANYLDTFIAAYSKMTDIPPEEAVLVMQQDGFTTRYWFERKRTHEDT